MTGYTHLASSAYCPDIVSNDSCSPDASAELNILPPTKLFLHRPIRLQRFPIAQDISRAAQKIASLALRLLGPEW